MILLLLILNIIEAPEAYTIVKLDGLNVYESNNQSSKKVAFKEYGDKVYGWFGIGHTINEKYHKKDTLDNIVGFWVEVWDNFEDADKNQNLLGYMFSPYLYRETSIENKIGMKDFRICQEGIIDCEIDYDPLLKWHKLSLNSDSLKILAVKPEFIICKAETKISLENKIGPLGEFDYIFGTESIILNCVNKEPSLFLIGSNEKLEKIKNIWFNGLYNSDDNFLFPYQTHKIYFNKTNYNFKATENVEIINDKIKREYILILEYQRNKIIYHQEIKSLKTKRTAETHSAFKTPYLLWVGDLNNDNLIEFIIAENTMNEGCGGSITYYLFTENEMKNEKNIFSLKETSIKCYLN